MVNLLFSREGLHIQNIQNIVSLFFVNRELAAGKDLAGVGELEPGGGTRYGNGVDDGVRGALEYSFSSGKSFQG
jgi:hypothetical protein